MSLLSVRSFRKPLFTALLFFTAFIFLQQIMLTSYASARSYSTCVANANSKFKTNTNSNGEKKPYANISDVGTSDSEYGVSWACKGSTGSARAVVWLATDYHTGWPNTIDVNTIVERTGTYKMYIVGSVVGLQAKWSSGDGSYMRINYASKVRLCADSDLNICWENAGITRTGDDWYYDSTNGYYFARAYEDGDPDDDGVYDNWWTSPQSAAININMDTFLSKATNIERHDTYDAVTVYMFRRFGFTGSTGVTPIKLIIRKSAAATFTGAVSATVTDTNNNHSISSTTNNPGAGQTITVSGSSYNVHFTHTIDRTDSGGETISNDWSTSINPTTRPQSVNALGTAAADSVSTKDKKPYTVRSYDYSGTINPGQTITYCESLTYNSKKGSGVSTENATKTTCIIVRREPEATFDGLAYVKAWNDSTGASVTSTVSNPGSAQTLTVGSGTFTLHFVHTIDRTDSLGHTVSNDWSTTISPTSRPNTLNPLGSAASDAQTTKDKTTYVLRDYTYTGRLYAGQSITYCETLKYDSFKAIGKTTQQGTKTACVIIKRESDVCASLKGNLLGTIYSRDRGYNYGQIGVKNRNISDSYTYYGSNNASGAVSIWARPGDEIKFEHNMCAGGVYARAAGAKETVSSSFRHSGGSDSTSDAGVSSRYLFGEQVSAWNDSTKTSSPKNIVYTNINESNILNQTLGDSSVSPGENDYYNNCNTGGSTTKTKGFYKIAGGVNASSCNNRVKTLDTGHTITQSLTWTNLGYDNGVKSGGNEVTATASVVVPYNYQLAPFVENSGSSRVAYLGESTTMSPGIVVKARKNVALGANSAPYATITKPTQINVKYYFRTASGALIAEYGVPNSSKSDFRLNQNGLLGGNGSDNATASSLVDNGGTRLNAVSFVVPDDGSVNVGDKVCVELSAYPADSHDLPNDSIVNGAGVGNIALQEGSNSGTWLTAASCITIAKKPTMSVESSNAYSATKYDTASYLKQQNNQDYRYGSWSEYGVFGRVRTDNSSSLFASGAALGYSRAGYPASRAANDVRAENGVDNVATRQNSNNCTFMTQTFANADCNSGNTSIGGVMATQYEQRIKERYGSSAGTFDVTGLGTKNYDGSTYYDVSGYGGSDVISSPSGVIRFDSKKNLYINALPNVTDAQIAENGIERPNRTIVYSLPNNNIVIDGNIGYDGGAKSTIDALAQTIIIAKKVLITDRPTYINAVIIADEVNTCGFVGATKVSIGERGSASVISQNQCSQALRFDAPVVTKKLVLNRTAGAGHGVASIVRAEIFNLNMANYLWSFNQMSRLSQATTTYLREIPTRY